MRSQKNWNLFRRLTYYFLFLLRESFENKGLRFYFLKLCSSAFLLFCFSAFLIGCDKEEMLQNRWNLQQVSENGGALKDSTIYHLLPRKTYYTFFVAQSLTVQTINPATNIQIESADGYYKLSKSKIEMRFRLLNQVTDINAKIKKLTKKELQLEYSDKGNTYLLKLYTN